MTPKTPGAFLKDLSAGKFLPAYYFFGDDDYRIIEAEKYLASQFIPGPQLTTNYRRLDGKKISAADLLAELAVYPMLGERQLIAVSSFQSFDPTEIEKILKMLNPPDPNRIIVFSSPAAKALKRKSAFVNKMADIAEVVEFNKLTAVETKGMVSRKLAKSEINIDPNALNLLTELIAGNRGALESETEKLINYKNPGETVTLEDIKEIASGYEVFKVFEVAECVVTGQAKKVLQQIKTLVAEGNNPTGILYYLSQHFISLYLVKNGKPLEARKRWLTYKFREQASKYEVDKLEEIIVEIARTDSDLRKSNIKPTLALETLVLKLVGGN
ncbi:MAG: DNA polymerase III subunit delta [Candidatus Zixiibacteriota bacterium]